MASNMTTKDFFAKGTPKQFEFALSHYDKALRLKAESKSSKPENVIKLDKWYQTELPKKIKSRGKDAHLVHDELVQTIKWKLARGKFRPNLVNLVQMNTPRVVQQETKKAFRKLQKTNDLQSAANALCNLKGVGPGLASAVLAAGAPHIAPFMADECLLAMPDVDSLDYTMKEYMRFVEYVKACVERLNANTGGSEWTPHRVELAVWTHYICYDLKPDILVDMPEANESAAAPAAAAAADAESEANNGVEVEEDSNTNFSAESTVSSACDEDSNSVSEAKNPPSSEPSQDAVANEAEVAAAAKNGNKEEEEATPKTNGNNSHSNGSEANAKEQNGDEKEAEAKVSEQQPNGELENGVKSSEESTEDLSSSAPSEKRSLEEEEVVEAEPAAKKLKSCEESSAAPEETPAPQQPAATPNATPQVAV